MVLDERVMGALVASMQEQCYVFVHDKEKLSKFFEEDSDLVTRRHEAQKKRDRLAKANAAMANIQVTGAGGGGSGSANSHTDTAHNRCTVCHRRVTRAAFCPFSPLSVDTVVVWGLRLCPPPSPTCPHP